MKTPMAWSWLARWSSLHRRFLLGGVIAVVVLVFFPVACTRILTRFEVDVSLSRYSTKDQDWRLRWSTIARRGVNLVDSSGNVGSASASFTCQVHPTQPVTWTVTGKATHWSASGDASDALGSPATGAWHGTVRLETTADGTAMIIDLHDNDGRAFVGNRRYGTVVGNDQNWHAH